MLKKKCKHKKVSKNAKQIPPRIYVHSCCQSFASGDATKRIADAAKVHFANLAAK